MTDQSLEQRIKQILLSSPAILYTCRAYGDFGATFVSENITACLGFFPQDCLDNPNFWKDHIHPDDLDRVLADIDVLFAEGHHVHEYRFRRKDGRYIWIHDEVRLIRDPAGKPIEIVGSWLDISTRKETETALRNGEALFREFFYANPVPTIITSLSGTIHMVNPAFAKSTGYTADEIIGQTTQELGFWQDPADREHMVAAIKEVGLIDNLKGTFYGKGKRTIPCLVSSRAVELENEVRILSIVIDMTEQKNIEDTLRILDLAKSDFISTAAHELRTPLTSIMGYTELLANPELLYQFSDEQKEDFLQEIYENCEGLARIIDDILDISRIEAGMRIPTNKQPTPLGPLLTKIVNRFRLKVSQELSLEIRPTVPDLLHIDAHRFAQVMENLLSNAVKYSSAESRVSIIVERQEQSCKFTVADQGIGMTPHEVAHIFDKFYRVDTADTAVRGLGLGMSIVKQIVKDHGGTIRVDSEPGAGTRVVFILPE